MTALHPFTPPIPTQRPVSQYTPTGELPELGDAELHPALDSPYGRRLAVPDRPTWTVGQLRDLTWTAITSLKSTMLDTVEFDSRERWWTRLALTRGVEVWLLSWTPGQGTEPHAHGGASGSFSVLLGELEEHYRYPAGPVLSARHPGGSSIGFGSGRAHQVRNSGSRNAASVHAYSPPLLPVLHYETLLDVPTQEVP